MGLAGAIAASPYADQLFPITSMFDIRVYSDPSPRLDFDFLRIHFNFDDGTFAFDYMEQYSIREKERWRKIVSADESFSGFIHFLVLKRWFPAKEIPRGNWRCDGDNSVD